LRVEYELWAAQECLGHYVLHLEIYHWPQFPGDRRCFIVDPFDLPLT
jgi:hypothetical protein